MVIYFGMQWIKKKLIVKEIERKGCKKIVWVILLVLPLFEVIPSGITQRYFAQSQNWDAINSSYHNKIQ